LFAIVWYRKEYYVYFCNMMQIPIESMNLLLLNVGHARHNADWNWKNVSSPFVRIFYVTSGEALLHMPEQTFTLRPGYMYFVPAYQVHSYECHGLFDLYYMHMYEGVRNEMNVFEVYEMPTEVKVEGRQEMDTLFEYLCSERPDAQLPQSDPTSYDTNSQTSDYAQRYRGMDLWEKMELRGAMLMILACFMRHAKPRVWTSDERMKRVLEHVHNHITDNIDVEELANVACVTKPYLIRLFKREFGTSPIQYINKKKVERAGLLLFTTNLPVKEVAWQLGFSDDSYFIRLFRKQMNITPQEYRARVKS